MNVDNLITAQRLIFSESNRVMKGETMSSRYTI